MTVTYQLRGLYAITSPRSAARGSVVQQVESALSGGARIIQYRDKGGTQASRLTEAKALQSICSAHRVPLIINDDIRLAKTVQAAGVHLGKGDPDIIAARQLLGKECILGASCYNSFERALAAQAAGADYVAFGRFFPSTSKPDALQANLDLLHRATAELHVPVVAIGGITPENGASLVRAGADMLAVIEGIFGQTDVRAACLEFQQLFLNDACTK